jgi:4-hydroxybenzoate polyprenyltransferase
MATPPRKRKPRKPGAPAPATRPRARPAATKTAARPAVARPAESSTRPTRVQDWLLQKQPARHREKARD